MPAPNAPKIRRDSLPDQVQEILREEIVSGVWLPGVRLPEIALSERFGVSRTPLREALKVLESEGLLQLKPHQGAIVTEVTVKDIEDKMRVLCVLEALAIEIACVAAKPDEIEAITRLQEGLLAAFQHPKRDRNTHDFYLGNFGFHQAIVAASHNETLIDMHRYLHHHVQRARLLVNCLDDSDNGMAEHDRVASALKARDADAAKTAMAEHMATVGRRLIEALRKGSTGNRWAKNESADAEGKRR